MFYLVWILITTPGGVPTYSPPVQTQEDCARMQSFLQNKALSAQCVQVRILQPIVK